jgi:hypothetical protein
MMNFYSSAGGLPTDLRPAPTSRPSNVSSKMPAAPSPSTTAASASATATEGKKKHGKFSFKSKDQDRPRSSHDPPLSLHQSPLPQVTPVKAAQLLGVDSGAHRARSGSVGRQLPHDGSSDNQGVRRRLMKQISLPMLTGFKEIKSRPTKFREEDVEPDPPKSKSFWGSSNKKPAKLLGLLPSFGTSSKRVAKTERVAAGSLARYSENDTNTTRSSEPDLHARPHLLPAAVRPLPEAPQRRMRKKGPKTLDLMAPITETSHDQLRSTYRNSEHNTELEVISEYEHDLPPYSAPLPRSNTESQLTTSFRYELEEDDLSSTDGVIVEDHEVQENFTVHPGKEVDLNKQPTVVHLRGPLQTVEDRLLAAVEQDLEATEAMLNKQEAARLISKFICKDLHLRHTLTSYLLFSQWTPRSPL